MALGLTVYGIHAFKTVYQTPEKREYSDLYFLGALESLNVIIPIESDIVSKNLFEDFPTTFGFTSHYRGSTFQVKDEPISLKSYGIRTNNGTSLCLWKINSNNEFDEMVDFTDSPMELDGYVYNNLSVELEPNTFYTIVVKNFNSFIHYNHEPIVQEDNYVKGVLQKNYASTDAPAQGMTHSSNMEYDIKIEYTFEDSIRKVLKSNISNIHMTTNTVTYQDIMEKSAFDIEGTINLPSWDDDTLLLALFNETLDGGNVLGSAEINKWVIKRREIGGSGILKTIGQTPNVNTTKFTDYTVPSKREYEYQIFPESDNIIGNPLVTDTIKTDFYGWYLVGEHEGIVYKFDMDLESGNIQNDTDVHEHETYTKYNAFSYGERDFIRGNIRVLAGTIKDYQFEQDVDFLNELRAFINNGKEKLLKSRKGDIWRVRTNNFDVKYRDKYSQQIADISFNFVESGDV